MSGLVQVPVISKGKPNDVDLWWLNPDHITAAFVFMAEWKTGWHAAVLLGPTLERIVFARLFPEPSLAHQYFAELGLTRQ